MPTTFNLGNPTPTRGTWKTRYYKVTAAQTFKVGDWLYLDASGTLVVAAAAGANVGAVYLVGRALANAADVLAQSHPYNRCPVECPSDDGEFLIQVSTTDAKTTLDDTTLLGGAAGALLTLPLRHTTAGQWTADKGADETNDVVVLTERALDYAVDDSEARPWFWGRILESMKATGTPL